MLAEIFKTDWTELLDVSIRCVLSLITLFLITKLLGKKQVSQLSLFDYVIGISIGNFAAEMSINLESQLINGIAAVVIFGIIAYLISLGTMKSIWLRRYFMGTPTILIQDGKLMEKGMKKVKFDVNDLLEECRGNGYFDMSEIKFAVMEANGKVSFLPKEENRPITVKDMKLKIAKSGLCANVIIDGKIMKKNLHNLGKTEEWLRKELKNKGYNSDFSNILLATVDINDKLLIYNRNLDEKIHEILE